MNCVLKRFWWLLVLVGVRLALALTLPVFNDESIYALWSQGVVDFGTRGLTPMLMDGKQPGMLLVWSVAQRLMGEWQPFLALRLVSIGLGVVTALISFKVYRRLTGKTLQWWQRLIVILTPGVVWFDSMGLQEAAVMAWTMVLVWMMVVCEPGGFRKRSDFWVGGLLGLMIGGAWWIKTTALIAVPGLLFVLAKRCRWKCVITGLATAVLTVSLLWLHPEAGEFWQASQSRVGESISFNRLITNVEWTVWWVGILSIAGGWWLVKNKRWSVLMVVIVGLLLPLWSGNGIYASRYIAGVFPVLAIAGVAGVRGWWRWIHLLWSVALIVGLVVFPITLYQASRIMPAVYEDLSQYMVNWTSGWGVKDAIHFVERLPTVGLKVVMVRLDSGNPESAVLAALWHNKHILGVTEAAWGSIQSQLAKGARADIYFVSRDDHLGAIDRKNVELIQTFERPLGSGHVGVWRFILEKP